MTTLLRAAQWTLAWVRFRRAARAAYHAGLDVVEGVAALAQTTPGSQDQCGQCHGRRCWYHRHGLDCPRPTAPKLTDTLGGAGKHEAHRVLGAIVDSTWSPLPVELRVWLAPTVHQPIVAGVRRLAALPAGRLP